MASQLTENWEQSGWDIPAANILQAVGLLAGKETNEQQAAVFLRALNIFIERNEDREDLWADYDEKDSLLHIRSKAARLEKLMTRDSGTYTEKDLDEAFDLINYCAFFIRHMLGWVPEK